VDKVVIALLMEECRKQRKTEQFGPEVTFQTCFGGEFHSNLGWIAGYLDVRVFRGSSQSHQADVGSSTVHQSSYHPTLYSIDAESAIK
jgi:hypothetical protein